MYTEQDLCAVCLWLRATFALTTKRISIYCYTCLWTGRLCGVQVVAGQDIDGNLSKAAQAAFIALGHEFVDSDLAAFSPERCPASFSNHALLVAKTRIDAALRTLAAEKSASGTSGAGAQQ